MSALAVTAACAAGAVVGFILGVIFFVILDDKDKSKRHERLYKLLATFGGLGGGTGVVLGFIGAELLPFYIGAAAIIFLIVALTSLFLRKAGTI